MGFYTMMIDCYCHLLTNECGIHLVCFVLPWVESGRGLLWAVNLC